jgi:choline dehydrogenase-like flavoprotein
MKILVVGAGAVDGYLGARLAQAGRDVTFLVRPSLAQQLRNEGLRIRKKFSEGIKSNRLKCIACKKNGPRRDGTGNDEWPGGARWCRLLGSSRWVRQTIRLLARY